MSWDGVGRCGVREEMPGEVDAVVPGEVDAVVPEAVAGGPEGRIRNAGVS
jgi:hypothetical protein